MPPRWRGSIAWWRAACSPTAAGPWRRPSPKSWRAWNAGSRLAHSRAPGSRVRQPGPRVRESPGRRRALRGPRHVAPVLRGEVRWADLSLTRGSEQAGRRPWLVLSHDVFNARSGTVIAAALTSQPQRAGFPLTLEVRSVRLPKRSWVKISQIRTLAVERLGRRIARISPEETTQVVDGLNEIIGE